MATDTKISDLQQKTGIVTGDDGGGSSGATNGLIFPIINLYETVAGVAQSTSFQTVGLYLSQLKVLLGVPAGTANNINTNAKGNRYIAAAAPTGTPNEGDIYIRTPAINTS
jgi:hypothetical protein